MTSLSRNANFVKTPHAPSTALAGFEAKPDETVATGFEAKTSKPRCRGVSPRPTILTTGRSLPVPLHSGHLVTYTGFPLALTWSSRHLHQPDSFEAKPVGNLRVARLLHVSGWIALDLTWPPDRPATKSQTCARSSLLTIKSTP